jgi:hypothetical protein
VGWGWGVSVASGAGGVEGLGRLQCWVSGEGEGGQGSHEVALVSMGGWGQGVALLCCEAGSSSIMPGAGGVGVVLTGIIA